MLTHKQTQASFQDEPPTAPKKAVILDYDDTLIWTHHEGQPQHTDGTALIQHCSFHGYPTMLLTMETDDDQWCKIRKHSCYQQLYASGICVVKSLEEKEAFLETIPKIPGKCPLDRKQLIYVDDRYRIFKKANELGFTTVRIARSLPGVRYLLEQPPDERYLPDYEVNNLGEIFRIMNILDGNRI